jgi:hypothetical protein
MFSVSFLLFGVNSSVQFSFRYKGESVAAALNPPFATRGNRS